MKKMIFKVLSALIVLTMGLKGQTGYYGGTSTNYSGNTTYHSFSDGLNGTSTNYGSKTNRSIIY